MESVRRKIKILDNRGVYFIWGGNTHINEYGWREAGLLYDPTYTQTKLELLQLSDFKDDKMFKVLSKVQKTFEESAKTSSVECVMTFDYSSKKHAMSARACFDEKLVKTLLNLLTEPKFSVTGTFNGGSIPFSIPAMEMNIKKPVENFDGAAAIVDILKAETTPTRYAIHTTIFLEWSDLKMTTIREPCAVLDLLFSEKLLADCCIVTSNKTEVSCHRCILAANSNVIRTMLTNGMQETQTNRIEMTDVSEEVVLVLVAYLYGRVMDTEEMKEEIAFDLLCTAHKYNIEPLEELMVVTLFNKPNDSFSMNTVLDVYFFTKNIEDFNVLCEKMLKILKGSPNQLLASSAFQEIMEKTPNEATKLALKLLQRVIGEPNTRALPAIEI